MLIAAIMGLGMNHGLGRLARSTPFSYRQLAWATDWHIREDTIRAALIELNQFVLHHPLARYWGDGTRSSSDGHARQSGSERRQRRSQRGLLRARTPRDDLRPHRRLSPALPYSGHQHQRPRSAVRHRWAMQSRDRPASPRALHRYGRIYHAEVLSKLVEIHLPLAI